MKKKRNRRARKPVNAAAVADRVKPTAETLAKLKPDALREMQRSGHLGETEMRAAQEISEVWVAITSGNWARAQAFDDARGGSGLIPERLARAHAERFLPWAATITRWAQRRRRLRRLFDRLINEIVYGTPVRSRRTLALALEEYHSPGALARRAT